MPKYVLTPIEDRFWAKVNKDGPTPSHCPDLGPCWEWTGFRSRAGYGQLGIGRVSDGLVYTHRFSWTMHHGPIPTGMCVLHKCDNPACVNPVHLFLGTQADNLRDMNTKGRGNPIGGRWARGSAHHGSKLTESAVVEIRSSAESLNSCALRFGVSKKLVLLVRQRKVWVHV